MIKIRDERNRFLFQLMFLLKKIQPHSPLTDIKTYKATDL